MVTEWIVVLFLLILHTELRKHILGQNPWLTGSEVPGWAATQHFASITKQVLTMPANPQGARRCPWTRSINIILFSYFLRLWIYFISLFTFIYALLILILCVNPTTFCRSSGKAPQVFFWKSLSTFLFRYLLHFFIVAVRKFSGYF